ncbi:MAG: spore germination protein [Bacillota bacterium]
MSFLNRILRLLVFREPGAGKPAAAGEAAPPDGPEKPAGRAASPDEVLREGRPLSRKLEENAGILRRVFRVPQNKDVVMREFSLHTDPPVRALAVFYDGMTDKMLQDMAIFQPLMLLAGLRPEGGSRLLEKVVETLLPGNQVETVSNFRDLVDGVLEGSTALLFEGLDRGLIVETKGFDYRGVEKPSVEAVIRGPQEAFTENFRTNTALVRRILRAPELVTEILQVGRVSRTFVGVMYMDGIASPQVVNEVRRRISAVKTDFIGDSGLLEQFIEDAPLGLAPQTLATERPDRVAANLAEGRVAILVGGSPFALVVPATFYSVFQTAEDAYVRWPWGAALRLVRFLGLMVALFLPGFYVAISGYHHEMIPTDLLVAMTGSRERVPFPTVVEVLGMDLAFELIREAGVRIPGTVGTMLGIVGALILGQAAVAANVVSPILIIVIALTAIGTFAISNYSLSLSVRYLRFAYTLLGAFLGIYGLVLGVFVHVALLASMQSFGVPYLAPAAPPVRSSPDLILRGPAWEQEVRPGYLDPRKGRRQPRVSRGWLPVRRRGRRGGAE